MAVYKVIAGTFHVKGFSPDGDSIRFQARDHSHWDFFHWEPGSNKAAKRKQLRIESIDAMETHYEGYHQPRTFALAALEALLEMVDIKDVVYSLSLTQIVDADDGKSGFIAAASTDRFGRPVSYLFPKSAKLTDGASWTPPPCTSRIRSTFSPDLKAGGIEGSRMPLSPVLFLKPFSPQRP